MKTSKKLLSLFLAVVMVITTCSVGFTAFAADGNKTDTNNAYWNDNTEADKAFDAITALINNYVPALANGALKGTLEKLGMTVDENTSLQDIVAGLSPALMKIVGAKGNKESIITNYYDSVGFNYPYNYYPHMYDYLDDPDAAMDFYALYQFCKDNENSSDDERREFAQDKLPKLNELLQAHIDAIKKLYSDYDNYPSGTDKLKEYKKIVEDGGIVFDDNLTLYELENFEVNGVKLKDLHKTDNECDTRIKYDNMYLDFEGAPFQIDNIAAALYYQQHTDYVYGIFYLYLATLGGANVQYNGETITVSNYKDVIAKNYSFSDFCKDNGYEEDEKAQSAYDAYCLNEVYSTIFDGSTLTSGYGFGEIESPYFKEISIGFLQKIGAYEDAKASTKSFEITDEQLMHFAQYVADSDYQYNLSDYIYDDSCAFSKYAREYLKEAITDDLIFNDFRDAAEDAIENNDVSYLRDFVPFDDTWDQCYQNYYGNMPLVERINFMIPGEVIFVDFNPGGFSNSGLPGTVNLTMNYEQYYVSNFINEFLGDVKYDYDNFVIPDSVAVDVVNTSINGYLSYLEPGTQIGDMVSEILKKFITSDINLYDSLYDIWNNLYTQPIETVFNLLPVVVVLLDEVLVPMVFNSASKEESQLYGLLTQNLDLLSQYTQDAGNTETGIGNLSFDLNKILPAILNWLVGNESKAYDIVGHYTQEGFDSNVPVFTNIYIADKALYGAHLNGGLAKSLKRDKLKDNPELADIIDEAVTEIATFALEAINDYLAKNADDIRYTAEGEVASKGLNNIFVALPEVLDQMGKNYAAKYGVDSDWTLSYKIKTVDLGDGKIQKQNTVLEGFKALATQNDASKVLEYFTDVLIGEWLNSVLDIVNDTIQDENNEISSNLSLIQGLLDALGGFGEKSIITDVFNGLFQLKRSDDATFTLEQRDNGFVGFSTESGIFLLSNILYKTEDGKEKGLIPFITSIAKPSDDNKADYNIGSSLRSTAPLLANSKKANKSAAGTDYSKLLTSKNKKLAQSLIDSLDSLLSSLLANTSLNGFDLDKTDNILSAVVTVASSYLGAKNTNDIVKLINNYLYYIAGETTKNPGANGKIGTLPKKGNVDANKIYTSANLSNLVIQTYALVENIVDYLFYNKNNGFLSTRDPNMLIADAAYGLISPDAVAVRLSDKYSDTAKILQDKDRLNWNSFKVEITQANLTAGSYSKDYLKFGFSKGDKNAFYDGLGESLSPIAGLLGAVLTASYTDSAKSGNYYSELIYPIFNSISKAVGSGGVMSPSAFNKASASDKLIKGMITPFAGVLDKLYSAPVTFLLNLVKGLSGILQDDSIHSLVGSIFLPLKNLLNGAANVVANLSPTLAYMAGDLTSVFDGLITLPSENIIVTLINNAQSLIKLPNINWSKLAEAKTTSEVFLLVYGYLVDTILDSGLLQSLLNGLTPGLTDIFNNLSATEVLKILNEVIAVVQSPTEIYWTFKEYASKLTGSFSYPKGILASEADKAVDQLDDLVANVFPLLSSLGVADIDGLGGLVNDKLYTNEILTTIAKALYGALSNGTVADILHAVSFDVSPKGFAKYLTDKSYGKTYSSAASTLKKAKSWDKVKSINWGFTNGTSKAQTGFINGLAALLRPLNNVLSVLLAEGKLDASKLDIESIIKTLSTKGSTTYGSGEYGGTIEYSLKNGTFILTIRSNVRVASGKPAARNVLKVDVDSIVKDFENLFGDTNFGTNGYESAVIPILEAFMCKNIKTYKQYKSDYKKSKDNLLIDILKPVFGLVDDVLDKPFDTVTKILPNVAYFIDSKGLPQAIGNLLAPVTAENGLLGVLKKNGLDIDKLIKELAGKDLGKIVTDAIGIKTKLNLKLNDLASCNIHEIVIPLVNKLLKNNKIGITVPNIDFAEIASHGKLKTVASKAKNDKGKYTTKQVKADQGEVLVAVLRYISNVLIKNAGGIKKLITNINAIKKNNTIKNIISSVFNQIAAAGKDDIVRGVFYLLTERATDSFFDYRNFKYDDSYSFSFGNMDEDFCRKLAPMLDGLIGGILEGGLSGLVEGALYKDDLVAKLATGLYGAVEGVKISDSIGSLTGLLAQTGIDFSASNVANLLTDSKYGQTYPAAASVIRNAGSWKNIKAESLKFGVKDRDSFMHALVAVLRPIYGVLDVLLNDASLNIFNLINVPGSDGYTSTIVPLLEAFGVYNVKTQYQYREDTYKAYDNILLDIINPLWDKVEDILNAPIETLADILPNLSLFFANDGLLQIVDNLFTPVSALLKAIRPVADINDILKAAGLNVPKLLKDKVGLNLSKFDLYDLPGTLKPLVGADNVVDTLNSILGIIKIKGAALGIVLPAIDWFKLASHGEFVLNATSQAATYGARIAVISDQDETLIAVLRFLIDTINYKDNYDAIVGLIGGLIGDGADDSVSEIIGTVLGMLQGDSDTVIEQLVDMLQQFA